MQPSPSHPLQCWTEEALNRFFTVEATEKRNPAVFAQTHLPIDRIKVENYVGNEVSTGQDIDEGTFRSLIIKSKPSREVYNRVFWLRGESGCGKSELCQWLALNIEDGVHVPVYIPRELVRPVKIYEKLAACLGEDVAGMIDITQLSLVTFVYALMGPITMEVEKSRDPLIIADRDVLISYLGRQAFLDRMRENFAKYRQEIKRIEADKSYADAKALDLLSFDQFKGLVQGLKNPRHSYEFISSIIERVMSDNMQVGATIDEKLAEISKAFLVKKLRPVLIIEDITSTGFLKNGILRFLLSKNAGHFDAVVGVTTGYHRDHEKEIFDAAETVQARLEGRFNMTDEKLSTLFLREGRHVDLAQRYLTAVKEGKCQTCAHRTQCYATFGEGLYPFNRTFLDNVYAGLQELDIGGAMVTKQTPRLYLRQGLMKVLQSDFTLDLPATVAERLSVKPPVEQFTPTKEWSDFKDFRVALKWYGEYDKAAEVTRVSETLLAMLGIAVPPGLLHENGQVVVNARPVSNELKDFKTWIESGGKYPTSAVLEAGVRVALKLFDLDQLELRNQRATLPQYAALSYQIKSTGAGVPIVIEGVGATDSVALTVSRKTSLHEVLSNLWLLGAKAAQGGKQPHDPSLNLVALESWVRGAYAESLRGFRTRLQKTLHMSAEHFVLTGWSLLKNLLEGINDPADPRWVHPLPAVPPILSSQIKDPTGARAKLSTRAELFNLLFQGMFYLRTSVIDRPTLDAALANFVLSDSVKVLRSIKTEELLRVRFSGNAKVAQVEMADVVRDLIQYSTSDFMLRTNYSTLATVTVEKLNALVRSQEDLPDSLVDLLEMCGQALDAYKKVKGPLNLHWDPSWEGLMRKFQEQNMQLGPLRTMLTELQTWSAGLLNSGTVDYFNVTRLLLLYHKITEAPQIGLIQFADQLATYAEREVKAPGQQDLKGTPAHSSYSQHLTDLMQEVNKEVGT